MHLVLYKFFFSVRAFLLFLLQAAVMKKMMYYNMRVRSAKRNLSEKQLSLTEKKKTLLQLPEERIRTLSYALKKVHSSKHF